MYSIAAINGGNTWIVWYDGKLIAEIPGNAMVEDPEEVLSDFIQDWEEE